MRYLAYCFAAACAMAQPAAFDAASLKRVPRDLAQGTSRAVTPTRLTFHQASLGVLLLWAGGLERYQVIGPEWLYPPTDVLFDVEAVTAQPATPAGMRQMLQHLLAERLGLATHREMRDIPVYVLTVDRSGPKFEASTWKGDPSMKSVRPYVVQCRRVTMADLAKTLDPPFTSRHVVDETGLTGAYDFTLDLSPYVLDSQGRPVLDARGAIDNEGANLLALPRQLGLRLERKTRPREVMVVDRVAKDPVGN